MYTRYQCGKQWSFCTSNIISYEYNLYVVKYEHDTPPRSWLVVFFTRIHTHIHRNVCMFAAHCCSDSRIPNIYVYTAQANTYPFTNRLPFHHYHPHTHTHEHETSYIRQLNIESTEQIMFVNVCKSIEIGIFHPWMCSLNCANSQSQMDC